MSDQYLGEIRPTAFNFAPIGWALCQGQILPIRQYTALFSLLGTKFGGDGSSNFGLPNLQQNVTLGAGNGAGLSPCVVGEEGGASTFNLTQNEMPIHTHPPAANSSGGTNVAPTNSIWALEYDANFNACTAYVAPPGNIQLPVATLLPAGGSLPLSVAQPTLTLNYIIALNGIFPPRP